MHLQTINGECKIADLIFSSAVQASMLCALTCKCAAAMPDNDDGAQCLMSGGSVDRVDGALSDHLGMDIHVSVRL